jgi:hypothetical protein
MALTTSAIAGLLIVSGDSCSEVSGNGLCFSAEPASRLAQNANTQTMLKEDQKPPGGGF